MAGLMHTKILHLNLHIGDKLLEDFYEEILKETAINSYRLPEGVSIHTRGDDDNTYLFVENYTDKEQNIMLRERFLDIENDMVLDETILLKAYDVRILKKYNASF